MTNGNAWIVFPAIRTDGVEFADTQARIFRSLEDIEIRFVEFWELLSRQRVIEGNLEKELLQTARDTTMRRALTLLREPDVRLARNTLYPHLSDAVQKALTDKGLLTDAEALSFCYVMNAERTAFDSRLKMYLADPKPQLEIAATRIKTTKKSHDYFDKAISESMTAHSKFFLVLGQVGVGKTTFLAHTRLVSAASAIDSKICWLYVDFKKATEEDVPREFLYERLLELIQADVEFDLGDGVKSVRPAYATEIHNLARGPLHSMKASNPAAFNAEVDAFILREWSAKVPYVDRIIKYAATQRPVFIVIDNVDQIEDDKRQNQIFSEAQEGVDKLN